MDTRAAFDTWFDDFKPEYVVYRDCYSAWQADIKQSQINNHKK